MTFQEFAAARLPAVLAFAAVLTGQRATAEDIAQEVLIRAYARWDTIGGLDRPEFYVRKMVLNEFLSWRRRSWRLIPAGDTAAAGESTSDHADQYAERAALLAEIGKLPRRQRAVLVLRYYEDRSDAEIAALDSELWWHHRHRLPHSGRHDDHLSRAAAHPDRPAPAVVHIPVGRSTADHARVRGVLRDDRSGDQHPLHEPLARRGGGRRVLE